MILADPRELEVIRILRHVGANVVETDTSPFDFLVRVARGNTVVEVPVERKTASDYVTSLVDGRLSRQLYLMSTLYPLGYLVVVGSISEALVERGVKRQSFISSLVGSALKRSRDGMRGQVVTLVLETDHDLALALVALEKKLGEGDLERLPLPSKTGKSSAKDLLVAFYAMLPGVGERRARLLAERYGSISSLCKASLSELAGLLGEKTGFKVYKFLREGGLS